MRRRRSVYWNASARNQTTTGLSLQRRQQQPHSIDEYSKWHEIATLKCKDKLTLTRWLMALIRRIQRVYNADVVAVRCDDEKGFGNDLSDITEELRMLYEPAPAGTKEPNGLIKRASGVLTQQARAMRIHANLPKNLSHGMYRTAAYILNRTPTEALGWKTPYEVVWGRKLLVAHMRPIECRAYVYNRDLKVADKLKSRVLIGLGTVKDPVSGRAFCVSVILSTMSSKRQSRINMLKKNFDYGI
jgi:hypothetical protein